MSIFSSVKWISKIENLNGFIEMDLLTYVERVEFLKKLNLTVEDGKVAIKTDALDQLIKIKSMLDKKVTNVDLETKGVKITCWDDLQYCSQFQTIINELSDYIFNGVEISVP